MSKVNDLKKMLAELDKAREKLAAAIETEEQEADPVKKAVAIDYSSVRLVHAIAEKAEGRAGTLAGVAAIRMLGGRRGGLAMTTTETMGLAQEVQDRITSLEKQRVELQQEDRRLVALIAEINAAARGLRMKLVRGDVQAGKTLADSDHQLLELAHRVAGVRLATEDIEKLMIPLQAEHQQRAIALDLERQAREVQRISKNVEDRITSAIAHHRDACSDYFYVAQAPNEARAANLDESHRSQILSAIERGNSRIVEATASIINQNWPRSPYGPRPLQIVAANPAGGRKAG